MADQEPQYNWLDAGRAIRQSLLPCLTLPCSPLPAGRGGVTADTGYWLKVKLSLEAARPKNLSQFREIIGGYAPGYLGWVDLCLFGHQYVFKYQSCIL